MVILTPQQACEASRGRWDGKKCIKGEGIQPPASQFTPSPTTPRELAEQTGSIAAGRKEEKERIAKEEAEKQASLQDQPFGSGQQALDLTQVVTAQGSQRTEQNGQKGTMENGVFYADEKQQQDQKVIFDENGTAVGLVQPDGRSLLGLSPADIDAQLQTGAVAADAQQTQNLAGQVGEFGELGINGTPFDQTALAGAASRGIIPGLIRGVGTGVGTALIGAKIGVAGGPTAAITLGALGFASGIASSILGEMKGQRTDNTNAQQRVLDEGKQVLSDWVTFAEGNPTQSKQALAGFNTQLALIDQAYRQMKLDTSRDILAFESAIPNLAEFTAFYSNSGERDVYSQEMQLALAQAAPIDTRMLSLISRRGA